MQSSGAGSTIFSRTLPTSNNKQTLMMPMLAPQHRFVLYGAFYVALWIGTWYSAQSMATHNLVSLWFLPAGLRFCNLLVFGRRGLWLELLVQGIFALMQLTSFEGPPIQDLFSNNTLWRLYNLLASLLLNCAVIFPLRRWMRTPWDFSRPLHSALLLGASLLVSTLSALVGTIGLIHLGFITPDNQWTVFPKWLVGDFVAIITLAPMLLIWVAPRLHQFITQGRWHRQHRSRVESPSSTLITTLIVVLSLLLVFGIPWSLGLMANFPIITLLLLLPLAGIALQYGLHSAVMAVALLDGGMVILIAFFNIQEDALPYQLVMISVALVGVWIGGAIEARNKVMSRYLDFADVSSDLLWETDSQGHLLNTSGRFAAQLSLVPGQFWQDYMSKNSQPKFAGIERAIGQKESFHNLEFELQNTRKETLWVQLNGLPLLNESGELSGYRGTAVDITASKQVEAVLRDYNENLLNEVAARTGELRQSNSELEIKERHLQVLLAAAPVGVLELDGAKCCRYINANGCTLIGYPADQAQGAHFLDFVHPDDRAYVEFVWAINHQSDEVHWIDFRLKHTNLRCTAHWIKLYQGDLLIDGTIMVLTNTTARSHQDERLWTLAHHDVLTELPNRNLFWDRTGQALQHAKRRESGAALLWIDLDEFKTVNDTLGHAAGDDLLLQVAQRLKSRIRDSDTLARMGGDEFAVIMPDITDAEGALQVASELVAKLAEPFILPQGSTSISGSIGIALYPQHAETIETLTQCADMAMYEAKHAGKNQVKVWNTDFSATS